MRTILFTGYYRVSTKAESQKSSFENQPLFFKTIFEQKNRKSKNQGIKYEMVQPFYCDYGETGTKLNRKGFKQMLEDAGLEVEIVEKASYEHPDFPGKVMKQTKYITSVNPKKKPKFEEIWVKSTSRFARNINAYEILQNLRRAGVYVFFIDIDKSTRSNEEMEAIRKKLDGDMSFSEQLSRNMRLVQEQYEDLNRVRGYVYGLDYHKKTKTSEPYYTVNPEQAAIVKKIFEYVCEMGIKATIARLSEDGIYDEDGKPFTKTRLRNMIKNEKYKGINYVGKYTTGALFDKFTSPQLNEGYKAEKTDALPQIIPDDLWQKANEAVAGRKIEQDGKVLGKHFASHKYKDILRCAYCGNSFIFDTNREYPDRGYYRCSTKRQKGVSGCDCVNVYDIQLREFIEKLKSGGLHELIEDNFFFTTTSIVNLIIQFLERYENPSAYTSNEVDGELKKKQEEVMLLMAQLGKEDLSESIKSMFTQRISTLNEELKPLEEKQKEQILSPLYCEEQLEKLFPLAFEDLRVFKEKKQKYTDDEVMALLDKIIVYGKSELLGGKTPRVSLVPVLKVSEKATALRKYGIEKFHISNIACGVPNEYEAPDSFIQSIRKDRKKPLPELHEIDLVPWNKDRPVMYGTGVDAERLRELLKRPPKSQWLKDVDVPYDIRGNEFDPDNGYIFDMGFENEHLIEQVEIKLNELYQRYQSLKKQKELLA